MKWRVGMITAVLLLLALSVGVRAHGGGTLMVQQAPVGEFTASVWFNPKQPETGETFHITVGLSRAEDGSAVLNETIDILIQAGDEPVWRGLATNEAALNRIFYETDLTAVSQGNYEVIVQVVNQGQLTIPLEIIPPQRNYRLLGLAGLLAVGASALFFQLWQRSPKTAKRVPKKQRA